jgi:hypothetical protein
MLELEDRMIDHCVKKSTKNLYKDVKLANVINEVKDIFIKYFNNYDNVTDMKEFNTKRNKLFADGLDCFYKTWQEETEDEKVLEGMDKCISTHKQKRTEILEEF